LSLASRAEVITDAPERYAKQLVSHLSRKAAAEEIGSGTRLGLDGASATITPCDGVLLLEAKATDEETLERVQQVVGSHLERFGARSELVVTWQRSH
jgi:hypothetical protein